jgi:hypothetical protein
LRIKRWTNPCFFGHFKPELKPVEFTANPNVKIIVTRFLIVVSVVFCLHRTFAITTNVNATCNIYGAGHTPPNDAPDVGPNGGGIAPALVSLAALGNPLFLTIQATGSVSYCFGCGYNGPDGTNFISDAPSYNGISGISNFPGRSLMAVFTSETEPANPAPPSLDFSVIGTNYATLAPQLRQIFFVGDGLADPGGVSQTIQVPAGATRLYLGFIDSYSYTDTPDGYDDNTGSLAVTVTNSFSDSLAQGINPAYWVLRTNTALFTVNTNGGDVLFSKPAGSTSNFQYMALASLLVAEGDFDVRINFTNASITKQSGSVGNQIQLNTRFGAQDFLVVRSDEADPGQNAHVFANPPGNQIYGTIGWIANSGTLRVTRTGTMVQGYIDATLIYQNNYNTNDATFSLALQNNQTSDAISVAFDDFQLTADNIAPLPPRLEGQALAPNSLVVSWKDTSWPDALAGYSVQTTTSLAATIPWQPLPNQPTVMGNQYRSTNSITNQPVFFRLKQGP